MERSQRGSFAVLRREYGMRYAIRTMTMLVIGVQTKRTILRKGVLRLSFLIMCILMLPQVPVHARFLVTQGAREPVQDRGWPKGAVEMANMSSRFRYVHVEGFDPYRFEYQGDTREFNSALEQFAKICAPRLELLVHAGPAPQHWNWRGEGEEERVDWVFTTWNPRLFHDLHSTIDPLASVGGGYFAFLRPVSGEDLVPLFGAPLPPPRIDVYIDPEGPIRMEEVEVPEKIEVTDERMKRRFATMCAQGVLVGQVYDMGTAKPIVGATIYLKDAKGPGRKYAKQTQKTIMSAKVNEKGAFELTEIPKGSYDVHIYADGYVSRDGGKYVSGERSYEEKVFQLTRPVAVAGTVIDGNGNPVAAARVSAHTLAGFDGNIYAMTEPPQHSVTDKDGRFEFTGLPEGYVYLACQGAWHTDTMYEPFPAPADDIRLMAVRTGTIRGRLVDSHGSPVKKVDVSVVRRGDCAGRRRGRTTTTAEGGLFEWSDVPPGEYVVGAGVWGLVSGVDPTARHVFVKPGETVTVEIVLPGKFDAEAERDPTNLF
jgi:hypothetical protein